MQNATLVLLVGEDQFELVWASKKNLSKQGSHMCDGTFKTAPCSSDNSYSYQCLILHAKYQTKVFSWPSRWGNLACYMI